VRRVVAVLGAVLMVIVAILARGALDGDDDSGPDGPGSDGGDGEVTLLCVDELADVCDALEEAGTIGGFDVEPAGETVDRMAVQGADLGADAWLTFDSFPQQADVLRQSNGANRIFGDPTSTDHSTGLAIAAENSRAEALSEDCINVDWNCLADAGDEPWADHGGDARWGDVKLGFDAPDTSATGLLVIAQAMVGHVGRPTEEFAAQDIDRRWLGDLEDAVPRRTSTSALDMLALQGAAAFGAVGALGNDAERVAGSRDLETFYPDPMFRAEVVLAAVGGDAGGLVDEDELGDALADVDWEPGQVVPALPSPGSLVALRQVWEEVS
jgi:hypothetical protein